jgi:hypothetical protein
MRAQLSSLFHRRHLGLLSGGAIIDGVNSFARTAIIGAAALALLAAACGGSPARDVAQLGSTTTQSSSSTSSPPAASAQQNGAVAYARCIRSNGVPNWPDPSSSGVFDKSKLTAQQLGASSSRVQAAQNACRRLLPNGGSGPTAAQQQQVKAQALRYSQCVRAHGLPSFPDPDSTGRIPDPASAGIDQGSPKFRAANQACGRYRPPYMPSNSAYDAYVRTHG